MSILDWAWFMAEDMQALPKHRKRVSAKETAGQCLCCEEPAERRGLCHRHHWRFRMELLGTTASKRGVCEKNRILSGTILPKRQGQGGGRPRKPTQELANR